MKELKKKIQQVEEGVNLLNRLKSLRVRDDIFLGAAGAGTRVQIETRFSALILTALDEIIDLVEKDTRQDAELIESFNRIVSVGDKRAEG